MGKFDWISFDMGRARFCGGQRNTINGGGQNILAVQFENQPAYYGRFDTIYDADHTHYSVEVFDFGYDKESQIGLSARHAFTSGEIEDVRLIISALMLSSGEKPFPLQKPERFLGRTIFKDGWIREK